MNILLLTEGGKDIGFGHLTRCLALVEGIKEARVKVRFAVNGDNTAKKFLRQYAIDPIIMDWVKEKNKILRMAQDSDLIIVDSYKAPVNFYESLYKQRIDSHLVAIDDYNRINYAVDTVINPSVYGDRLSYKVNASSRTKYLTGKNYVILRKEFLRVPKKNIRKDVKDILITFGGISHPDLVNKVIKTLSRSFPMITYHAVMPSGTFNPFNISDTTKVKIYSRLSALDMRNLMLKCDIAISGGGQTTYELARVGIPAISVCLARNQKLNVEFWKKIGFIKYAGHSGSKNVVFAILKQVKSLMDYKERAKRSNIGSKVVDGKGMIRVSKVLTSVKRNQKTKNAQN
jgi:UDP-2,4-diacetamido-2,4,6-trideoxy-beta-L-altropyranose hydrolase